MSVVLKAKLVAYNDIIRRVVDVPDLDDVSAERREHAWEILRTNLQQTDLKALAAMGETLEAALEDLSGYDDELRQIIDESRILTAKALITYSLLYADSIVGE